MSDYSNSILPNPGSRGTNKIFRTCPKCKELFSLIKNEKDSKDWSYKCKMCGFEIDGLKKFDDSLYKI